MNTKYNLSTSCFLVCLLMAPPFALPQTTTPDIRILPTTDSTVSEMSIAVSPLDNNILLAAANTGRVTAPVAGPWLGVFWSTNGGIFWQGAHRLPAPLDSFLVDPAVAIDQNGYFFVNGMAKNHGQYIARSTNNGATWSYHRIADTNLVPINGWLDKNHLTIDNSSSISDPYRGFLYCSWTDQGFSTSPLIRVARSTDHGIAWIDKQSISGSTASSGQFCQGVNLQTGPNGEVYATWAVIDNFVRALGFTKSTNGGATWGSPYRALDNILGIYTSSFGTYGIKVASFPSMAVSQQSGNIYIVWANYGDPPGQYPGISDIYFIRSTNGGLPGGWSSPARVTDDASNSDFQWHPWITVDPVTDEISIVYYSGRSDLGTNRAEVKVAHSTDGGTTFVNFVVSDAPFAVGGLGLPNNDPAYNGDYIGIASRGGRAYPVWNSQVPGTNSQSWINPIDYLESAFSDYFTYSDFSVTQGLALVNNAAQSTNRLRLTSAASSRRGAAWRTTKQRVQDGFETVFRFQFTNPGGISPPGADGIAFLVQNMSSTALGGTAGGTIGYTGITNSVAVEFDTWPNGEFGDPNGNHISVNTRGTIANSSHHSYSLGATTTIPNLKNAAVYTAKIRYSNGQVLTYLDNMNSPILTVSLDLATIGLDSGRAWVGFTSATGNAYENNDLLDWTFQRLDIPLPIQLASFTGVRASSNTVRLNWRTISEINNYGFFVQRRTLGTERWFEIPNSFIAGHGTTNEPHDYSFTDSTAPSGSLQYRLKQVDLDGTVNLTEPIQVSGATNVKESDVVPKKFSLEQNYPNPFNPLTVIKYALPKNAHVKLSLFNILGQRVYDLVDESQQAGYHEAKLDASSLASGVYLYRIEAGEFVQTKKLVLLR